MPTHKNKILAALGLSTALLVAAPVSALPQHAQAAAQQSQSQAAQHTQALIAQAKNWQKAKGANKAKAYARLEKLAEKRLALLKKLAEKHPDQVLAVAIPEDKQDLFPPKVLAFIEQQLEVEGELSLLFADDFENPVNSRLEVELKTPFGDTLAIKGAGRDQALQHGLQVRAKGVLLAKGEEEGQEVLAVNPDDILFLGAENSPSYGTTPGAPANTFGEQRTLVMMVNFQDDRSEPYTRAQVEANFDEVDAFIREASYGQAWMNTTVTNWLRLPISGSTCDRSLIVQEAEKAAAASGLKVSDFDRLVYTWPYVSSCGFSGVGSVGGSPSRAFFNGIDVISLSQTAHEIGHNLGLQHSHDLMCNGETLGDNCSVREYGDGADLMGSGKGHFNVHQKDRLGWLDGRIQTVTSSGSYRIAPQEFDASAPLALKVLKGVNSSLYNTNDWYFVELRQPVGFDSPLGNYSDLHNLTDGVTIHSGNERYGHTSYLLDMNPGTSTFSDAALETGRDYVDNDAGVVISTQSVDGSGAEVYIEVAGGGEPVCTSASPSLSVTPGQSPWVAAGTQVSYQVTLTNNDSAACSSRSFALSAAVASGWSRYFGNSALTLAPGASASTSLKVTSASTAADGFYDVNVSGGGASQTVIYVVDSPAGNSAPVAQNDSATTDAGQAVTINVLANDSDPDGDTLTVTSVSGVNGSAKINSNGSISFTPASGFSGTETFSYSVSDGKGGSDSATVTVNVLAGNSAPVAVNDSASTQAGQSVTIKVLANDHDPDGDSLTITGTSGVNGSARINSDGSISFTPASGFSGTETFSYNISDGKGGSASASVSVTVAPAEPANEAPMALADSASVSGGSVTIAVLGNDYDPDGDTIKVVSVTQGSKGSVRINSDGSVTYTPGKRFKNGDSFSYTISDGELTATAQVSIGSTSSGGGKGRGNKH
ncbi:Ig-like domain-containing protein [Gallaecimonas sp. GXIMD4217]|uniref:Ig-like domain-containing protein n=1 Tax=Gallaecimonas sp. GXIMD4217 TaxID=3131927 RepID=UPI00311AF2D0